MSALVSWHQLLCNNVESTIFRCESCKRSRDDDERIRNESCDSSKYFKEIGRQRKITRLEKQS